MKTISRPVIDRLPVGQLDDFASRQLDRVSAATLFLLSGLRVFVFICYGASCPLSLPHISLAALRLLVTISVWRFKPAKLVIWLAALALRATRGWRRSHRPSNAIKQTHRGRHDVWGLSGREQVPTRGIPFCAIYIPAFFIMSVPI